MPQLFWRLMEPEYESDYDSSFVNGELEHPFGLPGIRCDVCGQTSGGIRILPFPCPAELRERSEFQNGWPLPAPRHRELRAELAAALRTEGHDSSNLLPGDALQPCYLDVPSIPRADFLWASLGSVVVSKRIREILAPLAGDYVVFVPVELRRIGNLESTSEVPDPPSGEPEDLIEEVELLRDISGIGEYFEMIVLSESGLPRGIPELMICPGCDRPSYDKDERMLRMFPEMWHGAPIFHLATTLWIIVTDDIQKVLVENVATNISLKIISLEPSAW